MIGRSPSMQSRIAGAYLALQLVTLVALALFSLDLLRTTYHRTLQEGVAGQARLLAALIARDRMPLGHTASLHALVTATGPQLGARVTVVDTAGTVLADSLDLGVGENLIDRPEIHDALRRGEGASERISAATGDDRLYVAVPIGAVVTPDGAVRIGVPLPAIVSAQAQLATAIASAALAAGGITVLLAVAIARRVTQPLLDLRAMAGRVAAGDLSTTTPIPQDTEIAALAQDFNQMAGRLRQLLAAVEAERHRLDTVLATMADGIVIVDRSLHVTLVNQAGAALTGLSETGDVRSLGEPLRLALGQACASPADRPPRAVEHVVAPQTGRSLRAQVTRLPPPEDDQALVVLQDLTELRRAEQSRRMLMSNIAHDLRTPLASLTAIIETLEDGALDDAEIAPDFLRRMADEVDGLTRLVNDVLELSRIESGDIDLALASADIAAIARGAVVRMGAQARQSGISLALDLPAQLPALLLDSQRTQQALLNLIQNALAHTPRGGRISIGAAAAAGSVSIWVRDTGVGIAPDALPHIFERLYRGDAARGGNGTGLGLAIVKHLVERQSGSVSAESQPGTGTVITITFPCPAGII